MTKSSIGHEKRGTIRNIYVEAQTVFPRACGQFKMVITSTRSSFKSRKKDCNYSNNSQRRILTEWSVKKVLSISQYICHLVVMVGTFIIIICFVLSFFDKLRGLIMRR